MGTDYSFPHFSKQEARNEGMSSLSPHFGPTDTDFYLAIHGVRARISA